MKLSTKGRYGLRAMIDLAVYSEKEPVSIQSIADRQNISERYLEQLMASLKKEGLVKSIRGANGGYQAGKTGNRYLGWRYPSCTGRRSAGSNLSGKRRRRKRWLRNADLCVTRYVWQRTTKELLMQWIPCISTSWWKRVKN